MGGHAAWKKRVAAGGLAKEGPGGAIARHRPRNGRKGEDLKLNRKGNIAGGNPKKMLKGKRKLPEVEEVKDEDDMVVTQNLMWKIVGSVLSVSVLSLLMLLGGKFLRVR